MIYDAIKLIARTIHRAKLTKKLKSSGIVASCSEEKAWRFGVKFAYLMRNNTFDGLSGHIQFDSTNGYRTNFSLLIMDKTKQDVEVVI